MNRRSRTPEERRQVSEHLFYEVQMFSTSARALSTGVFGVGTVNNALLKSFTVHARVHLDFLFSDGPRPGDVIAEDFFSSPERWPFVRGDMPPVVRAVENRIGKEVAHLTYARLEVTLENKGWPFVEIAVAVEGIITLFLNNVPPAT